MLIMKYERKDFFGCYRYAEDSKENYSKEDVKKAFLYLSKEHSVTVQKENTVYFWDSIADYENKVITVRTFVNGISYTDVKQSFDKAKKECYSVI